LDTEDRHTLGIGICRPSSWQAKKSNEKYKWKRLKKQNVPFSYRSRPLEHFDRWWNPAVENQATDRAFRIGQKRNVLVHKFVTTDTVEERIDALIAEKQKMADESSFVALIQ